MKRIITGCRIFAVLTALLMGSASQAATTFGFRQHNALGAWTGSFSQTDGAGHELNVRTLTSMGVEVGFGLGFGIAFIDYNATWFIANHTLTLNADEQHPAAPSNREGPYFSPLGFTLGASIPYFPIQPYLGMEKGSFGFSSGAKTNYSGTALKAGVNFHLTSNFGLRLEYRKHYLTSDDAGTLPSSVTTRFSSWFLGIVGGSF